MKFNKDEKLEEEYDLKIVKEFEEKEKNNETEFFDYEYVMEVTGI